MAKNAAYREAKKKIEEAWRSEAKKLDLRAAADVKDTQKLTELPESLSQLTQLESLDLYENELTTLPESLGQLTQLQLLNLRRNRLIALPMQAGELAALKGLYLHGNPLLGLPPEMLGPTLADVQM